MSHPGENRRRGRFREADGLKQSEPSELTSQVLGHVRRARRGTLEILGCAPRFEVAPALERPEWPRLGQHELRLEHQPAAADAVAVPERPHVEDTLAAQDLAP